MVKKTKQKKTTHNAIFLDRFAISGNDYFCITLHDDVTFVGVCTTITINYDAVLSNILPLKNIAPLYNLDSALSHIEISIISDHLCSSVLYFIIIRLSQV